VLGAPKAGADSRRCTAAIIPAMRAIMAQWCAPCRRQQAGRLASSLASSVAVSGPSPKSRIIKMAKLRRI
jgi:hypothetical protein